MTTPTNDYGKFPAGHAYAWRGDWQQRLADLLAARGHASVTSFLAAHPRRSLLDLASELGGGDVAAVQLLWTVLEESKPHGVAVEHCARDLLVRSIHQHFPQGWSLDDEPAERHAYGEWVSELDRIADIDTLALWETLVDRAPPGWLPEDINDPVLAGAFRDHWHPRTR